MKSEATLIQALQFQNVNAATIAELKQLINGARAVMVAIECGGHEKALNKSNLLCVHALRKSLKACGESVL